MLGWFKMNLGPNKSKTLARKAFRDILDSFKENSSHPCPDYGLKHTLEKCAFRDAANALKDKDALEEKIVIGLNLILDYERLLIAKKPVPTSYLENIIKRIYEETKND